MTNLWKARGESVLDWIGRLPMPAMALATLNFAVALTPSLIPREPLLQGVLCGIAFSIGWAVGLIVDRIWYALEIPHVPRERARTARLILAAFCLALIVWTLWQSAGWQNTIRSRMGLDLVETIHPYRVAAIAAAVFLLLSTLVFGLRRFARTFVLRLRRSVPRNVARLIGGLMTLAIAWVVFNGVLVQVGLRIADSSFREVDAQIDADTPAPTLLIRTGSPQSLVAWEAMGSRGRDFISTMPDAARIEAVTGDPAVDPVRVFVGLNSAESVEARADLALREMLRVDAFSKSVLVVIVPTGTGWIDPAAMDTLEYLHRGDVASVAVQYSYLASALSLLIEPGYGAEVGRALFTRVYEHWRRLPPTERPRLYLHGLSLGALNSELSTELFDTIGDPIDGALWAGPPFPSTLWRQATTERRSDSPAWLPRFRDGSIIRFTDGVSDLDEGYAPWGPMRIVFLQYSSDPIVFFEPTLWRKEPAWLREPRGPEVSPDLRWFPLITMLQIAIDMLVSTDVPLGHGHLYAPEHYLPAWAALTDPPATSDEIRSRIVAAVRETLEPPAASLSSGP